MHVSYAISMMYISTFISLFYYNQPYQSNIRDKYKTNAQRQLHWTSDKYIHKYYKIQLKTTILQLLV